MLGKHKPHYKEQTMEEKNKNEVPQVLILNKVFDGAYTEKEGNIAHEIIDFFKADNGKIYFYNNPYGQCPDNIFVSKDYKKSTQKTKQTMLLNIC